MTPYATNPDATPAIAKPTNKTATHEKLPNVTQKHTTSSETMSPIATRPMQ
jgi:hypothetical protein